MFDIEHPDITSTRRDGYPRGAAPENRDTAEARRAFAEEYQREFLDFVEAGDADLLERFAEHYRWLYKSFLN